MRATNTQKGHKGFLSRPLLDRIMEKIEIDPTTKCWNWTGTKSGHGYGRIWLNGRNATAHRCTYELFRAPIPDDREIDHLCKNKPCVNPNHLEVVTHVENMLRAFAIKKTHCKRGHEMTYGNTYTRQDGRRQCRACILVQKSNYRALQPTEGDGA